MKMRIFTVAALCVPLLISYNASAETYYFNRGQMSESLVKNYASWETYNEEFGVYEAATGPIPIDEIDGAETVLRRKDTLSSLQQGSMSGIDSSNVYVKSIIYEVNTDLGGASAQGWQFYTYVNGGTCDMSVGNVLIDADIESGYSLSIRKRQADANFNLTLREGAAAKSGELNLGSTGSGEFLTSLTFGADANGVAIDINGSDAQNTDPSVNIISNEIYGLSAEFSDSKSINITKGTLSFKRGDQGTSPSSLSAQNADLSGTVLNMGLASRFYYGTGGTTGNMDGWIRLGDVVVSGTVTDTWGVTGNNDRAQMNFNTTAAEGYAPGTAPVTVGTITLDSGDPENDLSRLDFTSNANAYIEKLVSANIGGANAWQGVAFNSSTNSTITVGSMDIALRRMSVNTHVVVENDLVSFYYDRSDAHSIVSAVAIVSYGSLTVKGNLIMRDNGSICFDAERPADTSVTVTVGGISGGDGNSANRITTSYSMSNNVETVLAINGDFNAEFSGRLHDFGQMMDLSDAEGRNYLSILKEGSGVQILRGDNYYRGTTTVNSGELYMRADGATRTEDGYGIGKVILNGGKFGAIGASGNIGEVRATDLTWSNNSTIAVDFSSDGTCDLISLSGNFLKAEGDASGLYTFEFNGNFAEGSNEYLIISWGADATVDFSEGDFAYDYNGSSDLTNGSFEIRDNGLYFVAVPEPAEYAALFGAFALGLALLRRRRK